MCVCRCLFLALTSRTRMRHTQSLICLPAVAGDFGGGSTVLCGSGQTDSECLHCGDAPSSCNSQDCRFNPFPAADSTNTYDGVIYKCEPGDGIPDPSSTHLLCPCMPRSPAVPPWLLAGSGAAAENLIYMTWVATEDLLLNTHRYRTTSVSTA